MNSRQPQPKASALWDDQPSSKSRGGAPAMFLDGPSSGGPVSGGPEQLDLNQMMAESNASIQRSMRLANDAEQTGAATMVQLHSQTEQIKRVGDDLDAIDENLKTSDRLIRGIESIGGSMMNWFSKGKRTKSDPTIQPTMPGSSGSQGPIGGVQPTASGAHAGPSGSNQEPEFTTKVYGQNATLNDYIQEQDKQLDQLSGMLGNLKNMGVAMGGELDKQSQMIDQVDAKVDHVGDKLKGQNRRINKML
eukprot:GFYU01002432.1.p1 GENE.GFYU01002432.1~~GFYU01002432.1.p1  ORF type:complete len:275 (-),score=44.09 GFYU01002432.1:106-849(-)